MTVIDSITMSAPTHALAHERSSVRLPVAVKVLVGFRPFPFVSVPVRLANRVRNQSQADPIEKVAF